MPGDNPLHPSVEKRIDARIDAALRSYAEPPASDPRTAAAAILQRARTAPPRRPLWIWAIPAAACLALAVGLIVRFYAPPAPSIAHAGLPTPAPAISASPAPAIASSKPRLYVVHRPRSHAAPLPRLDVFPTPAPLSSQEQALVAFVRHAPPAVTQAVIDDQRHWDRPPSVSALNISPPEVSGIPNTAFEEP